jgi:hypothetical protein
VSGVPSDYISITKSNRERLGTDLSTRASQISMYADVAHFVFEIIQNADDTGATSVSFYLSPTEVVIEHNGKVFDQQDVRRISYFGKGKVDDYSIGEHGLGFKSVFSYTASPIVHSGAESFRIQNLYELFSIPKPPDLSSKVTRIILPFNHNEIRPTYFKERLWKTPERAYSEISEKLYRLRVETILFTRSVNRVLWRCSDIDGNKKEGTIERKVRESNVGFLSDISLSDSTNERKFYWVYSRAIKEDLTLTLSKSRQVQVALKMTSPTTGKGPKLIPCQDANLFVFFETLLKSESKILLQAPFRTTPDRHAIEAGSSFNEGLLKEIGELLVLVLDDLRDREILDFSILSSLPLMSKTREDEDELYENLMFPVLDSILRAMLDDKKKWFRTLAGNYVAYRDGRLTEHKELASLFSDADIQEIFEDPDIHWFSSDLVEFRQLQFSNLDQFQDAGDWEILNLWDLGYAIELQGSSNGESFICAKSNEWIRQLYAYIWETKDTANIFWNFIRTESGKHISIRHISKEKVYLRGLWDQDGPESLEFIAPFFTEDGRAKSYLTEMLAIPYCTNYELDIQVGIDEILSSSMADSHIHWSMAFEKILSAIESIDNPKRQESVILRTLKLPIYWGFNVKSNLGEVVSVDKLYIENDFTRQYFSNSDKVYLVRKVDYSGRQLEFLLRWAKVPKSPRMIGDTSSVQEYVTYHSTHGSHKRGMDGFDPRFSIDGLEDAVSAKDVKVSKLVWGLLLKYPNKIRGYVEISSRNTFQNSVRRAEESVAGKIVVSSAWIPTIDGRFCKPSEVSLGELAKDFHIDGVKAQNLARSLGMRHSEEDDLLLQITGGDIEATEMIQSCKANSEIKNKLVAYYKEISKNSGSSPDVATPAAAITIDEMRYVLDAEIRALSLPLTEAVDAGTNQDRVPEASSNPTRYAEKSGERASLGLVTKAVRREKVSSIWVKTKDSHQHFFEQEYAGRCQITGESFLKVNGRPFIQVWRLVKQEALGAQVLDHLGNLLCVSASTHARLMHAPFRFEDELYTKVEAYKPESQGGTPEDRTIRLSLAGENKEIRWTDKHFLELSALLKVILNAS